MNNRRRQHENIDQQTDDMDGYDNKVFHINKERNEVYIEHNPAKFYEDDQDDDKT